MKSILSAKMGSIRKRSTLQSSNTSTYNGSSRDVQSIPREPSTFRGKMRIAFNDPTQDDNCIDVALCVTLDGVQTVADLDNSVVFEASYRLMKEIIWDHTEQSVSFVLDDGTPAVCFEFTTLAEVEAQIAEAIQHPDLHKQPEQVFIGVLIGKNIPSPIQQRRASTVSLDSSMSVLPATKRRELLSHERPSRNITSRELLGMQYLRTGALTFACSINGDNCGLRLDQTHLNVLPSPDCVDRSACLFSYPYDSIETCEIRGTRLELGFRRSTGAKQPSFIAFQTPDTLYIRDSIWYLKSGDFIDAYYRGLAASTIGVTSPRSMNMRQPSSSSRRRNSLTYPLDEEAIHEHVQARCIVVGCQQRKCRQDPTRESMDGTSQSRSQSKSRSVWYCPAHTPGSWPHPVRSLSKRGRLTREKSLQGNGPLMHTRHYVRSIKYHGLLMKNGGKYQLTKSWNQKYVALVETAVGGFLCYYDKLAHCPGMVETPKERRVVDLCAVICIRRRSIVASAPPFAFDIVTLYRTWTFAALDAEEYDVWLNLLSDAVEKHSSMAPDQALRYQLKGVVDPLHNLPSKDDSITLEISSYGVTVCAGSEGVADIYSWYFTDIQKWSVVVHHGETCCLLSCLGAPAGSETVPGYHEFLFLSNEAAAICHTVEFFVSKCMAKLEILSVAYIEPSIRPRRPSSSDQSTHSHSHNKSKPTESKQVVIEAVQLHSVGMSAEPVVQETRAATAPSLRTPLEWSVTPELVQVPGFTSSEGTQANEKRAIIEPIEKQRDLIPVPIELPVSTLLPQANGLLVDQRAGVYGSRKGSVNPFDDVDDEPEETTFEIRTHPAEPLDTPVERVPHQVAFNTMNHQSISDDASTFCDVSGLDVASDIAVVSEDQLQPNEPSQDVEADTSAREEPTMTVALEDVFLEEPSQAAGDAENDRFLSFEYVECVIREHVELLNADTEEESKNESFLPEDEFEDVAESSFGAFGLDDGVVFLENGTGDEDSMILLEDISLDDVDSLEPMVQCIDPDDVLDEDTEMEPSANTESSPVVEEANDESFEELTTDEVEELLRWNRIDVQHPRIPIPAYSQRHSVTMETAYEHDAVLPRRAFFWRGCRLQD